MNVEFVFMCSIEAGVKKKLLMPVSFPEILDDVE